MLQNLRNRPLSALFMNFDFDFSSKVNPVKQPHQPQHHSMNSGGPPLSPFTASFMLSTNNSNQISHAVSNHREERMAMRYTNVGEDIEIADDDNHCVNGTPIPLHKASSFMQSIKDEDCGSSVVFSGGDDSDDSNSCSSTDKTPPAKKYRQKVKRNLVEMFVSSGDDSTNESGQKVHQSAGASADFTNDSAESDGSESDIPTTSKPASAHAAIHTRNASTASTTGMAGMAGMAVTTGKKKREKGIKDTEKRKDKKRKLLVPKDLLDSDEGRAILLRVFTVAAQAMDGVASVLGHGKIGCYFQQ